MNTSIPVLILPTVHLGGTGPATLLADYSNAIVALGDAMTALEDSYHDRDYYIKGETLHRHARQQHIDRCGVVRSLIRDLKIMQNHVGETRRDNL